MQNPFATLEDSLRRIEANQNELLQRLNAPAAAGPEVGGIELACEVLRLSKPRIYTLVSERAIPHMKRGGRLTFSRAELLSYLQAGSRNGATTNGLTNGR